MADLGLLEAISLGRREGANVLVATRWVSVGFRAVGVGGDCEVVGAAEDHQSLLKRKNNATTDN